MVHVFRIALILAMEVYFSLLEAQGFFPLEEGGNKQPKHNYINRKLIMLPFSLNKLISKILIL